jgi:Helix-turn-helix domain
MEARTLLARQLAGWRQAAGFTQAQAAHRIGYSRSAVARAEATGVCSRDYCRLAGQLYGAGDQLALTHDRIGP